MDPMHYALQLHQLQKNLQRSEQDLARARQEVEQYRRWIIGIGQAFVPETLAALTTQAEGLSRLDQLTTAEIVALIMRALSDKLTKLKAFTLGLTEEQQKRVLARILKETPTTWMDDPHLAQAREELEQERARRQAAEERARQAEERVQQIETRHTEAVRELIRLRREIQTRQAPLTSPTPPNDPSDHVLFLIASRGLCEQTRLVQILRDEFGLAPTVIEHAFETLLTRQHLEVVRVRSETGTGRTLRLVRLSEAGQHYVRETLKLEPVPSELDRLLQRHDTREHVLLILQTRALFLEKYPEPIATLDLFPEPIDLDDGKRSEPDLKVTLQKGTTLLIECERGGLKDHAKRFDKWGKYFRATQGEFYVVCPNPKVVSLIVSELGLWHHGHGGRVHVRVTSIAQVLADSTHFWAYERIME